MIDLNFRKFFSGRFVFTVVTAFVFAYVAVKGVLSGPEINAVIMLVISFYFHKDRIDGK